MRFHPFPRATDCDSGLQYYTCSSSGYSGCCSVDACDYTDGCPDSSSSSSSSSTATSTSSQKTSTSTKTSTITLTATKTSTISSASTSTSTSTTAASSSSSASADSASSSTPTASATSSAPAPSSTTDAPSTGLSSGAMAGIIVGIVAAFLILAAFLLWQCCWRRRRQKQKQLQQQPASGSPNLPSALEKTDGLGEVDTPLSPHPEDGGGSGSGHSALEAALALLGLQGTWLGAFCKKQPSTGPHDYGKSANLDLPEMPGQTGPRAYMVELDAEDAAVTPELESPPLKQSSGLPQVSPPLSSVTEGQSSTPTCVSPWYSSGTTASTSGMPGSVATTPELSSTARLSGVAESASGARSRRSSSNRASLGTPQQSPTEWPRATLDVTPRERMQGKHVGSWMSYQP